MVADSSRVIRTSAAMVLEPTGIGVVDAPNQVLAMKTISEQPVDLVLLDSDFDSSGGQVFIEWLHSQPQHQQTPVILLVGLERKESLDASAANAVLVKPFDSQALVDRVEEALDGKASICPTCQHPVESKGKTCPSCQSRHHTECWKLCDGCGKCGSGR